MDILRNRNFHILFCVADLRVQYRLDPGFDIPRLYFLEPEGLYADEQVWPLDNTNTGACIQRIVFVRDDANDKLSPIEAKIEFSANAIDGSMNSFTKFSKDTLKLLRNCGADDICQPEIKLDVLS